MGGGFQEKGKYLGNIYTVACKVKGYIFLLRLSTKIKATALFLPQLGRVYLYNMSLQFSNSVK